MMIKILLMLMMMTSDGVSVPLDKPILLRLVRQSPVSLPRAGDESLDKNSDGFEAMLMVVMTNLSCKRLSEIFVKCPV